MIAGFSTLSSRLGLVLLAIALVSSQIAWAQPGGAKGASSKTKAVPASAEQESETEASKGRTGDPSHVGIKVHGHWTIEVRNPDGSVATHREFENSLTTDGAAFLAHLLANLNTPVSSLTTWWSVYLGNSQGGSPAQPCGGGACILDQGPLTVTSSGGSLVLSGTIAAQTTTVIDWVSTTFAFWVGQQLNKPTFTSALLTANPVPVSAGQTIAVTVTISFS